MGRENEISGCGCEQCTIRHYRDRGFTLEDAIRMIYGTDTPESIYRECEREAALQDVEELHRFF